MTNAKKPPGKKLLGLPGSQDSVETKLLRWVRGVVLSNDQLVDALESLRSSYKVLQTGKDHTVDECHRRVAQERFKALRDGRPHWTLHP
jgi:hypothetical protein